MLSGFYITAKPLEFKKEQFVAFYRRQARRGVEEGINAFLDTVLKIIPIYTGMAQASLLALGELVNRHWIISPATRATSRVNQGRNLGEAKITSSKDKVWFAFRSRVKHLLINEQIDARIYGIHLRSPAPWRSFEQGRTIANIAMIKYMKQSKIDLNKFFKLSGRIYRSPRIK